MSAFENLSYEVGDECTLGVEKGFVMKKELIRVVQRAQSGDEEAFQFLYQNFYKQAYATAFIYCKSDADAKDAVHDAFYSIQKALPNLRSPEIFDYWMTRIIRTKCIKLFAKHNDIYMDEEGLRAIPNKRELRKDHNPYENCAENEERELMHSFVNQLSEKQRVCIEMFYFDQLSLLEIAKLLNISVGTVKSRLFEARKALKKYIITYEQEQGTRVSFRVDTILPVAFFAFFQEGFLISKCKLVKEGLQQNSFAVNVMVTVNVVATVVTVGALGVGGVYIQEEFNKSSDTAPLETKEVKSQPSFLSQKSMESQSFPVIAFKGEEYATPRAMYYAILTWYQKSGSSTAEELNTIKQMYETLKSEEGQYWDMLKTHEWSNELEQS